MFLRRVIQKTTFTKFIRNFCQVPGSEGAAAQTINAETPDASEAQKKAAKEEQLKAINEYKEALHFYQQGKYRISNEFFSRVLNQIEASGQKGSDNHIHILKKLVSNQLMLRRYTDADEYLEELVDTVQNHSANDALIYAQYNNLFLHRLRVNVNKAILMGKALLSENEKQNLPLIYQKQFLFNLGVTCGIDYHLIISHRLHIY
jgi:tetratricopeptide (TPR) repeat protein